MNIKLCKNCKYFRDHYLEEGKACTQEIYTTYDVVNGNHRYKKAIVSRNDESKDGCGFEGRLYKDIK